MSLQRIAVRTRAVVGLALAQLRRAPGRTALTVVAVMLAVLSVTLLASLGVGVVQTGEDGLENANRDIWISSDPIDPAASGTANPIVGSHGVSADITERDDISSASPIAMHEVYIGTESGDLERTSAVGVHETHDGFDFEAGGGFETVLNVSAGEHLEHQRTGEPTNEEIVLDPNTAETLDVSVGDTVFLGTSRETAQDHEFTVVGIAAYYSQYLGSDAEAVPLTDLQAVAGTAGTDRATFITASVEDGADRDAVSDDLAAEYPAYDVRTSDEQVGAMFEERSLVLASGATLVGLALVGGIVLTINLFALVAYQQRDELAALRAIGLSRWVLAGTIGVQGLVIGLFGGLAGLAATPVLTMALNHLASSVVGFDSLLQTPLEVYVAGLALAIVVGTVVAVVTGWRAGRYARLEHLEG
ncbi:ABC transporter permease [Natronorubrum thiooxidans]|uniref:Putative ABC transport system permease protein n=1 Tax=Natronorubrum thiooxidans TaxID=308853 RepID=A0A1N7E6T1_9EURY|nr:ABC transporter permease [Natronorubrum thiooxidans]SIR83787.1 putative ABC transport system permease protein [Natronorubrum thiooxidans]